MLQELYDATGFFWIFPLLTPSPLAPLSANLSRPTLPSPAFLSFTNAQGSPCPQSLSLMKKAHQTSRLEALLFQEFLSQGTMQKEENI